MNINVETIIKDNVVLQLLITVIVAIVLHILLRALVSAIVDRMVRQRNYSTKGDEIKRRDTLKGVLRTLTTVVLWVIVVLVLLRQSGIDLGTLATGAGFFGVIFGFGARGAIQDFVSGLCIIGEDQYRVGDVIRLQIGSVMLSGTVEDLTIRITKLRDLDGNLHIVSNGTPQSITNLSYEYANVNINLPVSYYSDIDKVEKVVNQVGLDMASDEKWAKDIYDPISFLRLNEFEESAMLIKALGKVRPAAQWAIAGEFRKRITNAFDENGIIIPYSKSEADDNSNSQSGSSSSPQPKIKQNHKR